MVEYTRVNLSVVSFLFLVPRWRCLWPACSALTRTSRPSKSTWGTFSCRSRLVARMMVRVAADQSCLFWVMACSDSTFSCAGVCRRGHDRLVPGGARGVTAAGAGGKAQVADVGAGDPQPSRAAGGDVRLRLSVGERVTMKELGRSRQAFASVWFWRKRGAGRRTPELSCMSTKLMSICKWRSPPPTTTQLHDRLFFLQTYFIQILDFFCARVWPPP